MNTDGTMEPMNSLSDSNCLLSSSIGSNEESQNSQDPQCRILQNLRDGYNMGSNTDIYTPLVDESLATPSSGFTPNGLDHLYQQQIIRLAAEKQVYVTGAIEQYRQVHRLGKGVTGSVDAYANRTDEDREVEHKDEINGSVDEKKQYVAIKRFSHELHDNYFRTEITIVDYLLKIDFQHPNVVQYYRIIHDKSDNDKQNKQFAIVMERGGKEGGGCTSLASYIEDNQEHPLKADQIHLIATHLIAGLSSLFRANIVHGDFAPRNILITFDSNGHIQLKIVDFSHAILLPTEHHPPKEPPSKAHPSHRADLFSVGIILMQCMQMKPTGYKTFPDARAAFDKDRDELVRSHGASLVSIVDRMLSLSPESNESASTFIEYLKKWDPTAHQLPAQNTHTFKHEITLDEKWEELTDEQRSLLLRFLLLDPSFKNENLFHHFTEFMVHRSLPSPESASVVSKRFSDGYNKLMDFPILSSSIDVSDWSGQSQKEQPFMVESQWKAITHLMFQGLAPPERAKLHEPLADYFIYILKQTSAYADTTILHL